MAFKLMMSVQKKWRKLDGQNRLAAVIHASQIGQRDDIILPLLNTLPVGIVPQQGDRAACNRRPVLVSCDLDQLGWLGSLARPWNQLYDFYGGLFIHGGTLD